MRELFMADMTVIKEPINPVLERQKLIDSFNQAASTYAAASSLQKYVGEQLLDRLEMIKLAPAAILDLGSGPGQLARVLEKKYTSAKILQLDIAEKMLHLSRRQASRFFSRQEYLCADADALPLAEHTIDLVFSNLMLQWSQGPDGLLNDLTRIIRPEGLFVFSSLGPDTLRELRESWAAVDDRIHVNTFIDMHDLGDALVRAGFSDPVMEVEKVTLSYTNVDSLLHDLKGLGAHNVNVDRRRSLTGKHRYQSMQAEYEKKRQADRLPATYEVIYGHAWIPAGNNRMKRSEDGLFRISLEQLRRSISRSGN